MNGDYRSADRKALAQLLLASLGGALLLGSTFGAAFGMVRGAIGCWCCDGIDTNC